MPPRRRERDSSKQVERVSFPPGFACHIGNIGMKDDAKDVMVLTAFGFAPAAAAGVFTRSRFAGASVRLSQANVEDGRAQAVVVVSKNANVATGEQGRKDAETLARRVAEVAGCEPDQVLVGSTGVIGVPYPTGKVDTFFDRLRRLDEFADQVNHYFDHLAEAQERAPWSLYIAQHGHDDAWTWAPGADKGPWLSDATAAAEAIMTTDTHPKTARRTIATVDGRATIVGIAKGSGMIEPDMATMISVITTDAEIAADRLDDMLGRVCDVTFNALSVDTDTSTSDMVVMLANGYAGRVDAAEFEAALGDVCLELTRQLATDGEGAETLIVVTANGARDDAQAKRVAKAIVNSPLVKTAVHGHDPNWGRVAMAIGKCSDETDIDPDRVRIRFGDQELYPTPATPEALVELEAYLASDEVLISVDLGVADGSFTVYGCDLTDQYVRINADYTT